MEGKFTELMKKEMIPNGIIVIMLIIAWLGGFIWRGIYI